MTHTSIAMATYNGARYIEEQLASLAAQERLPDELVITDDGSSDDTVEKATQFAKSAPFPVRIERNSKRLGYSANFERAISLTRGDVIFICDQDDAWYPDKISSVCREIDPTGRATTVVNDQRIVDADGIDSGMTMFGNFRLAQCPDTDLIAGSCTAITRDLLSVLLPFPPGLPYDSWIGAVADTLRIKRLIERPLQIYRRHDANASDPIVAVANPSPLSAFKRYGFADPKPGWRSEMRWRSELHARLGAVGRIAPLCVPPARLADAMAQQRERIDALRRRLSINEKPRVTRLAGLVVEWRNGLYEHFDGLRSAAKDLLRP